MALTLALTKKCKEEEQEACCSACIWQWLNLQTHLHTFQTSVDSTVYHAAIQVCSDSNAETSKDPATFGTSGVQSMKCGFSFHVTLLGNFWE